MLAELVSELEPRGLGGEFRAFPVAPGEVVFPVDRIGQLILPSCDADPFVVEAVTARRSRHCDRRFALALLRDDVDYPADGVVTVEDRTGPPDHLHPLDAPQGDLEPVVGTHIRAVLAPAVDEHQGLAEGVLPSETPQIHHGLGGLAAVRADLYSFQLLQDLHQGGRPGFLDIRLGDHGDIGGNLPHLLPVPGRRDDHLLHAEGRRLPPAFHSGRRNGRLLSGGRRAACFTRIFQWC